MSIIFILNSNYIFIFKHLVRNLTWKWMWCGTCDVWYTCPIVFLHQKIQLKEEKNIKQLSVKVSYKLNLLKNWGVNRVFQKVKRICEIANPLFSMVGATGLEPAASWSRTMRAPICAMPRHILLLYNLNAAFSR